MDPREGSRETPVFTGRAVYAISQSYYYVASFVGMGFFLVALIVAGFGLREAVWHSSQQFSVTHQGVRSAANGLALALIGGGVALWHQRQARARAGYSADAEFWGAALYAHLVALLSLIVSMAGAVIITFALIKLAFPACVTTTSNGFGSLQGTGSSSILSNGVFCLSTTRSGVSSILNGAVMVIAAGGVWFWHLRRGKTYMSAPPQPPAPPVPAV